MHNWKINSTFALFLKKGKLFLEVVNLMILLIILVVIMVVVLIILT